MRPLARVLMGDAASGLIRIADRRSCGAERLSAASGQAARIHWQAVQNGTSRGLIDRARRRVKAGVDRIASGKVLAFRLKLKARSSSGLVCTDRLADNSAYRLQGSANEPTTEMEQPRPGRGSRQPAFDKWHFAFIDSSVNIRAPYPGRQTDAGRKL